MNIKTDNIFINSGIRHEINNPMLQSKAIEALGYALGYVLSEEYEGPCNILIANDGRPSGMAIKNSLITALIQSDHDIFDGNIAPTPAVAKALKDYQPEEDQENQDDDEFENQEPFFDLGIIVTASHNPDNFNGLKIITPYGYLDIEAEKRISEIFHAIYQNPSCTKEFLPDSHGSVIDFDLMHWYQSEIIDSVDTKEKNETVLIDCAHGASSLIAEKIFQACGYKTIAINNNFTKPINQNAGFKNTKELIAITEKHNATWGCAFDGDADRVIIVHKNGTVFDGDDIISVLMHHPNFIDQNIMVGTIMSNGGLHNYCRSLQKKLITTAVGERNLINALIKEQAMLGAESCGHIIIISHAFCSDGIFSALLFLETMKLKNIPAKHLFEKKIQLHETIDISKIQNHAKDIALFIQTIQKKHSQLPQNRIIIRRSNTEPVIRIMIETDNENQAQELLKNIILEIKKGTNYGI